MTKLFNFSNAIARQLDELKRLNRNLSYSEIMAIVLKDFDSSDFDSLLINQNMSNLTGKLPNLSENVLVKIQIIILKLTRLNDDQLHLAEEGLLKFINDMEKIPKEESK